MRREREGESAVSERTAVLLLALQTALLLDLPTVVFLAVPLERAAFPVVLMAASLDLPTVVFLTVVETGAAKMAERRAAVVENRVTIEVGEQRGSMKEAV
jgi:hypothetical protein